MNMSILLNIEKKILSTEKLNYLTHYAYLIIIGIGANVDRYEFYSYFIA